MSKERAEATITLRHLPNGYWYARIEIQGPTVFDNVREGDSFHTVQEAVDWARLEVENVAFYL